jgi:hypothetical protein
VFNDASSSTDCVALKGLGPVVTDGPAEMLSWPNLGHCLDICLEAEETRDKCNL